MTVKVVFIHHNVPGVLRQGEPPGRARRPSDLTALAVNEVLGDHNVDKQMTDNRGEVAYLLADISDVNQSEIKDLYESLESLSCESCSVPWP